MHTCSRTYIYIYKYTIHTFVYAYYENDREKMELA